MVLICGTVALDNRYEPSVRDSLHREVSKHVKVPDEIRLAHLIAAIGLVGLLTSVPLLMTDAQISMV